MMKIRFLVSCGALVLFLASSVQSAELLIIADEWPQMEILGRFLEETAGYQVTKVEQSEFPKDLSSYEAAVDFIHGAMDGQVAQSLINFTRQGGRLIVLHHAISGRKRETPGWFPFLGVKLDGAADSKCKYTWIHDVDFSFVNLNPKHYITSHNVQYSQTIEYQPSDAPSSPAEFPALMFPKSEVFVNHQFIDGREKTVLFGFRFQDPQSKTIIMQDRSGWYKSAGKGWVFYLHPGHLVADFENRNYLQIIWNCLTWKP